MFSLVFYCKLNIIKLYPLLELLFILEFAIEFLSSNPSLQKTSLNHLIDYGLQLKKNKDDFVQFIYKLSDNLDPDDVERVLGKCKQIDEEIFVKLVCELELENKYKEISQVNFICFCWWQLQQYIAIEIKERAL